MQPYSPISLILPENASENDVLTTVLSKTPQHLHDIARALYSKSAAYAPYLARLIARQSATFQAALNEQYESHYDAAITAIKTLENASSEAEWMQGARQIKEQVALITALADIDGFWDLQHVTQALSFFADHAVQAALLFLLKSASKRGEWDKTDIQHHHARGIIVLGMGKLGAHELNYSSDIDIILLFDPDSIAYTGLRSAQLFMNKIAQQLTHLLQHRTEHGYVLRTDLRLRPDPASTPPAVSTLAALHYYETVGQNWERAAMIKARPIAGDIKAGTDFLHALTPYIWRKHLDFHMIADINSIMRQMHAGKSAPSTLFGHNVKTGVGGIRSIEFLAQTQQLVWGGRNPSLRTSKTLSALTALKEAYLLNEEAHDALHTAYHYLRAVEHRLQMLEDAQTHSLPGDDAAMQRFSRFMGFRTPKEFTRHSLHILQNVQQIYQAAMQDSAPLTDVKQRGNLVFTGVGVDDETRDTLHLMGYEEAERITSIIQNWHRGARRATRSRKARQLLTELIPTILEKLSETAHPDTAFFQFDDFLNHLPASVQIFSLIYTRPEILSFISHILGSAKALGQTLSTNPLLLDAMMEPEFFMPLPDKNQLLEELKKRLSAAKDFEQIMELTRVFHNEKRFQAGAHMIKHLAPAKAASWFLSDLAETELSFILEAITQQYHLDNPHVAHVPMAVLGFGRIGARDLTFESDLDLVILYGDTPEESGESSETTQMEARKHVHRLAQRFINALTSLTREGRLYEVDTRLRPGGNDGPLAAHLESFDRYFETQAWTFEHMALTKARVVAHTDAPQGSVDFMQSVQETIRRHIMKPRDQAKTHKDIADMRARVAKEFGTENPWHLKYVAGGLMDIEFIAQYLVLIHAHHYPMLYQHDATSIFTQARALKLMDEATANTLIEAYSLFSTCLSFQRLCAPGGVISGESAPSLLTIMSRATALPSPESLTETLLAMEGRVRKISADFGFNIPS